MAVSSPLWFQSRAPNRQAGIIRRIFGSMPRPNKKPRPKLDLEAEALAALEQARTMPPGPERNVAMKQAGILRNAAELQGIFFCEAWKTCQTLSLEALLHLDEENSHDCG